MLRLAKSLSDALPDTAFLAPDAPEPVPGRPGRRMWYTIPELDGSSAEEADARLQASARRMNTFLDEQLADRGIDPASLALLGFSQGAGVCYEVGPRRAVQLAGVVAIAGRMKRKESLAAEVRTTPPFLVLNGASDHFLDEKEIEATAATLSEAGIPVRRMSVPNTGHGISEEAIAPVRAFLQRAFAE
jgi:phospholipase/carboxylesterase